MYASRKICQGVMVLMAAGCFAPRLFAEEAAEAPPWRDAVLTPWMYKHHGWAWVEGNRWNLVEMTREVPVDVAVMEDGKEIVKTVLQARDFIVVHPEPFSRLEASATIKDDGLKALQELPGLTSLSLAWATGLTDDGLAALAKLTTVRELDLSGCAQLTDAAIAHLARMPALEELVLDGCVKLTADGLAPLAASDTLRWIRFRGCPGITLEAKNKVLPRVWVKAW